MDSGAIVTRRTQLSVALAVCGAIAVMAGCALALAGEARRLESAGGWQSLMSLGLVLIVGGFALGAAFAVVTAAGRRDGGGKRARRGSRAWRGSGVAGASRGAGAPLGQRPGGGVTGAVPSGVGGGLSGPGEPVEPGGWAGADGWTGAADGWTGADGRARADGWGGAGVWGGAWHGEGGGLGEGGESGDVPRVAGRDKASAEDWLSHLRGSGLGPVNQAGRAAPAHGPPASAGAGPGAGGFGMADYADEGWQLDGPEWAESQGRHPAQPPGPEIHHPAARRRHDAGQQPGYDTGQWRAVELDQPPDDGRSGRPGRPTRPGRAT